MVKKIVQYRAVGALGAAAVLFALGGFAWAYGALSSASSGPYILHFNDMTGITSVGGVDTIISMGILGLVITVMNFFIALELEERDIFLGKVVAGGTLIFAALLFIAFAAILNVNV
jgi:hypothetical protein